LSANIIGKPKQKSTGGKLFKKRPSRRSIPDQRSGSNQRPPGLKPVRQLGGHHDRIGKCDREFRPYRFVPVVQRGFWCCHKSYSSVLSAFIHRSVFKPDGSAGANLYDWNSRYGAAALGLRRNVS
jgi:hypothetical protein